jgi:hypothetical protein
MAIAQKALYNSLRISWLQDRTISVEPWKIEDLRLLSLEELLSRLQQKELVIDKAAFKSYADQFDGPEELTEWLIGQESLSPEEYDQIFLIIFELWRRLLPEKPSVSILCDELDQQIFFYDLGKKEHFEELQDALNNLSSILAENVDHGLRPEEVFSTISEYCAHDLEHFLYDYIADQIDAGLFDFARELLEQFYQFIIDKRPFDLLRARLLHVHDVHRAGEIIGKIYEESLSNPSLDLAFDVLAFLIQGGSSDLFKKFADQAVSLLEREEDFQELLTITKEYLHGLDYANKAEKIQEICERRKDRTPAQTIGRKDPDIIVFRQLLEV